MCVVSLFLLLPQGVTAGGQQEPEEERPTPAEEPENREVAPDPDDPDTEPPPELDGDPDAYEEERAQMVERQLRARDISNTAVLEAMETVPRHLLVPEERRAEAYSDRALPIGHGQTVSQPYVVATMTELLELEGDERVLEIGTGSGYHAAVLAEVTPHVYSIEIIEELGRRAARDLEALDYDEIELKIADGYFGWEEHAPFDAVIVTAAAGHVPQPLVDQLRPGGRIVIPVGDPYGTQQLTVVDKDEDGSLTTEQISPVRFVPMTGEALDE